MSDLKHALRQLTKAPAFSLLAILSLAIGIGVNSTIFSVMDAAFLRPLPVENSVELVRFERPWLTFAEYEQIHASFRSLSGVMASIRGNNLLLSGPERSEMVRSVAVSDNYFSVLGVGAVHGQVFSERSPDLNEPIVVLSHGFWQKYFGGDPGIVGQTITLNFRPWRVVGVTPPKFAGENRTAPADLWYPARTRDAKLNEQRYFMLVGRLHPGSTVEQAHSEVATLFAGTEWAALGENRLRERTRVVSEHTSRMDHGGRIVYLFGPIVGLVLLVACANVSCLLLGRYEERRREIAVRLALGASRSRVIRYLLVEASLLSLAGGALALLLTLWGISAIPSLLPPVFAWIAPEVHVDARVIGLTFGLATFATLAFGLMPALRASRLDVSAMLKADVVHLGKTPSRNVLVVAQVTVAMTFLALGALFVRGFSKGVSGDLGFSERNLLLSHVVPERPRDRSLLIDEMRDALRPLPGVRGVTAANALTGGRPVPVLTPDDAQSGNARGRPFPCNAVDADYFSTIGLPLLAGREFTAHDAAGAAPVAIVSESFAKRFWPDQNPVGQTLFAGRNDLLPREIVGVVRDVIDLSGRTARDPLFYLPLRQERSGDLMLIVKTEGPPTALARSVREALRRMDTPTASIIVETVSDRLRMTLFPQWIGAWLGGVLGILAFALAVSGLYGVVAYSVSRRTRELGIRIAMGASPSDAVWLVLRQGLTLSVIGVIAAAPVAIGVGQVLRRLLVGIEPTDPVALAGSSLLVISVATLASWLPARRATHVNPVEALRAE